MAPAQTFITAPHLGREGVRFCGTENCSARALKTWLEKKVSYDTDRHAHSATKVAPDLVSQSGGTKHLALNPKHKVSS